ncbi:MAG: hypothetical protein CBE00_14075 [Planctomycetaceae bacterium TMED240]|nr:hypothetical protein [Rhodopirellula sp.]OUX03547.1 MAG: hypothetical protein CBE00_14075 [Planctomycetaceae bacterium TMED240]
MKALSIAPVRLADDCRTEKLSASLERNFDWLDAAMDTLVGQSEIVSTRSKMCGIGHLRFGNIGSGVGCLG